MQEAETLKFVVSREILLGALGNVGRVVPERGGKEILTGALYQIHENFLTISGYGTDVYLDWQTEVEVERGEEQETSVEEEGKPSCEFVLNVRRLREFISHGDAESVAFFFDGSRVQVTCGKAECRFIAHPAKEYPKILPINFASAVEISTAEFLEALRSAPVTWERLHGAGAYRHAGIAIRLKDSSLELENAKGNGTVYLHFHKKVQNSKNAVLDVVLHPEAAKKMVEIVGSCSEKKLRLSVARKSTRFGLEIGAYRVFGALFAGEYPPFRSRLSLDKHTKHKFSPRDFLEIAARLAAVAPDESANCRIRLEQADCGFVVRTSSAFGDFQEFFPVEPTPQLGKIELNYKYLSEICRRLNSDEATWYLEDALQITAMGDEERLYILAPLLAR
jgi:DNA polymerase III sliding clamp (beta) subunit (PCNA family)